MHFAPEGDRTRLVWPVLFLYPEFGDTDFIEAFHEDEVFGDHLEAMFGAGVERPPWDQEGRYRPDTVGLYYEDEKRSKLVRFDARRSLREVVGDERYLVKGGTPGFIVMVEGSEFHKDFLKKYE